MPLPRRSPLFAAVAALVLAAAVPVAAVVPPVPAVPPAYVVDLAGVVDDADEARLNALLRELEERTTAQVLILTVRSLEGESLEAFSLDVAHNRWKLGQKEKDNGVLLTLAQQERRYRIEVGYGLEAILPDSLVGGIGRQMLVPAFRAGDYGGGLTAAAGEIASRIAAASGVTLSAAPAAGRGTRGSGPRPLQVVVALLFGAVFLWLLIRHPGVLLALILSRGGSRGSWGGGGGGFGGGGFGGGGGGGFGGGGASGSW
jgi:uncharacterized protein